MGSSTNRRFTLGDKVSVQVLAVKRELRQIDFVLVGEPVRPEGTPAQRGRRARSAFEGKSKKQKRPEHPAEAREKRKKGGRRKRKRGR